MYNDDCMRNTIGKMFLMASDNVFIRGGFFLTAGGFLTSFMNYLFNIFVARALGPSGYGEITAMYSYLVVLTIPMGVVTTLLIQKIGSSKHPKTYAAGLNNWFILKAKKWWYLILVFAAITPFIPAVTNLTVVTSISLPLLVILSILGAFYNGAFQGLHLFLWFTIVSIVATGLKLTGAIFAIVGLGGINTIMIFILLSGVLPIFAAQIIFKKITERNDEKPHIVTKAIRHVFTDKQLWLTTGATGVLALLNNVDIIYVKKMFSADDAGIYSSWALFAKIIFFFFGPLISMAFIFFSSKKHEVKHQVVFIGSFILFVVVGVVTNLGYGAFGRQIVDLLFGGRFWSVIPYMEWASYFGVGYLMLAFMTYYFLAKKSRASLLPAVLFPLYMIALLVYPQTIADVMFVDTVFVYVNVTIFLLIFFKDRFLYLIR